RSGRRDLTGYGFILNSRGFGHENPRDSSLPTRAPDHDPDRIPATQRIMNAIMSGSLNGREAPFFRPSLKLAKTKHFPAFFAPLCPRLAQWLEREADTCFLPSCFWFWPEAIDGSRATKARQAMTRLGWK